MARLPLDAEEEDDLTTESRQLQMSRKLKHIRRWTRHLFANSERDEGFLMMLSAAAALVSAVGELFKGKSSGRNREASG